MESPKLPIYLDNHATTPCDPRVVEAMLPFLTQHFGNAASRSHAFGWAAEAAVEQGRERVAALIGATPREIVFTSGATESDNLALKGVMAAYAGKGRHLVTQVLEHKAVLDTAAALEAQGGEVTRLPVGSDGLLDPDQVAAAIRPDTVLVSVMHANNEIGVINPLPEIGRICKARGVLLHTDAAQSVGRIPVQVDALGVDLLSISAHKMYGPKGVGALYVRRRSPRVTLAPQIHGGGHERGRRSGTLPVHQIVGLGMACVLAAEELASEGERIGALRDRLHRRIVESLPAVRTNGSMAARLPGNLNLSFGGVEAEALLMALRDVAVSSGAACTSATLEPSHVLRGIGLSDEEAHASIRFGLGRFNTEAEIDHVGCRVVETVSRLRAART